MPDESLINGGVGLLGRHTRHHLAHTLLKNRIVRRQVRHHRSLMRLRSTREHRRHRSDAETPTYISHQIVDAGGVADLLVAECACREQPALRVDSRGFLLPQPESRDGRGQPVSRQYRLTATGLRQISIDRSALEHHRAAGQQLAADSNAPARMWFEPGRGRLAVRPILFARA